MKKARILNSILICYSVVIAALVLYGLPFRAKYVYIPRVISLIIIVGLLLFRIIPIIFKVLFKYRAGWSTGSKTFWKRFIIFAVTITIGLIFFSNIFCDNPLSREVMIRLGTMTGEIPYYDEYTVFGDPLIKNSLKIGDYREMSSGSDHSFGLKPFASYYGGILLVILTVNFLFVTAVRCRKNLSVVDYIFYEIFLVCAVSIPCLLFFMDFFDLGFRAWIKSRFLEIPIYLILFILFYFVSRLGTKIQKVFISIILIVYSVVPFVYNKRPQQIQQNHRTFMYLLKKG